MASILPFIRKYINSKEKTIDKQIEELMDASGIMSNGTFIAQGVGTTILDTDGDVFNSPCNGIYRLIVVGRGGTPNYDSHATAYPCGACTALVVTRLSVNDRLDISKNSVNGGSNNFSTGINVFCNGEKIIFVPNVNTDLISGVTYANDCGKDYVVIKETENTLFSAIYPGLSNGSVGCVVPGLMANEPIQGPPTANIGGATNAPIVYPTGRGFTGYMGSLVKNPSYDYYAFGAHGYGAAGCRYGTGSPHATIAAGGPAACIITLLKKE